MTPAASQNIYVEGTVAFAAAPRLRFTRNAFLVTCFVMLGGSFANMPSSTSLIPLAMLFLILAMHYQKAIKASPLLVMTEEGLAWYEHPEHIIRWSDIERLEKKRRKIHIRLKDRAYWLYPFGKKGLKINTDFLDSADDEVLANMAARFNAYAPIEAGPELYED